MAELCVGAEKHETFRRAANYRLEDVFAHVDEAIAMAVMYVANHLNVRAIIALTESGSTPLWMSRVRSDIPVFAFTRHEATRRRVSMYRGVYAVPFDIVGPDAQTRAGERVRRRCCTTGAVSPGDLVLFTKGDQQGVSGRTNYDADPHRAGRASRARSRRVPDSTRKALVLPGAGARGAYQVGVLKAVASLLPKNAPNPFAVIAGTSAGAINAAVLAGRAANFERARRATWSSVWANFHADQVYRTDNWTMLKSSLHWLAAIVFGGLGVRNPHLAARQLAAARAARARRALRRHRARDRAAAISRRSR